MPIGNRPPQGPRGPTAPNDPQMLRNQSGSALLMARALGAGRRVGPGQGPVGPQNPAQPGQVPPNPLSVGGPNQQPGQRELPPFGGGQQQGSGSTGSFYSGDQQSHGQNGTYYVGSGLWHSDQSAKDARPDTNLHTGQVGTKAQGPQLAGMAQPNQSGFNPGFAPPSGVQQPGQGGMPQGQNQSPGGGGGGGSGGAGSGAGAGRPKLQKSVALPQGFAGQQISQMAPGATQALAGYRPPGLAGQDSGFSMGGGTTNVQQPNQGAPTGTQQAGNVGSQQSNLIAADNPPAPGTSDTVSNPVSKEDLIDTERSGFITGTPISGGLGLTIDENGDIFDSKGKRYGNISDPSGWNDDLKKAFEDRNNNSKGHYGSATPVDSTTDTRNTTGNYGSKDWTDSAGNIHHGPNPNGGSNLDPGAPPQLDEAALAKTDASTRANFARQKARAMRSMAEAGAYGGAGADQMAASIGDTGIGYGLAAESETARNHLQMKIQNFQAQMDWYGKAFAAKMAEFQATQNQKSFQQAMEMANHQAELQKQMIAYQNELDNQIGPKDIAGMGLGLASSLGSAALGSYFGGNSSGGSSGPKAWDEMGRPWPNY